MKIALKNELNCYLWSSHNMSTLVSFTITQKVVIKDARKNTHYYNTVNIHLINNQVSLNFMQPVLTFVIFKHLCNVD